MSIKRQINVNQKSVSSAYRLWRQKIVAILKNSISNIDVKRQPPIFSSSTSHPTSNLTNKRPSLAFTGYFQISSSNRLAISGMCSLSLYIRCKNSHAFSHIAYQKWKSIIIGIFRILWDTPSICICATHLLPYNVTYEYIHRCTIIWNFNSSNKERKHHRLPIKYNR